MKRIYIGILSVLLLLIIVTGISFSFFLISSDNEAFNTDVTSAMIANMNFVHGSELTIPNGGIYPGWIGIQEFRMEVPEGLTTGSGTYTINIDLDVAAGFSSWLSIEVYKTTNYSNTLTRVEADGDIIFSNDSLVPNGIDLEADSIFFQVINSSTTELVVDTVDFDISTFENTKYYVVYRFERIEGNQNSAMGQSFRAEILGGSGEKYEDPTYKETLLAGADPELTEGLIPIVIANDGSVTVANLEEEWYKYENAQWANAVMVDSSQIANYQVAGTTISSSHIKAYFVWIPRFEYKIFNTSASYVPPRSFEITFVDSTTIKKTNPVVGEYYTHPAFTVSGDYGTSEVNGFWVSKFDTTGTTSAVTSLPNASILHNQTVATFFNTFIGMDTLYGVENADSHMLKNMEWGAITYLATSIYGINEQIWANVFSSNKTGCGATTIDAAKSSTCSNLYGTVSNGVYMQSTTGNITGVFDMAGGAWEYVMAVAGNSSGEFSIASSGFTSAPDSKYYDLYTIGSVKTDYSRAKYGDTIREANAWYNDDAYIVIDTSQWMGRGGDAGNGSKAGLFNFGTNTGVAASGGSARAAMWIL